MFVWLPAEKIFMWGWPEAPYGATVKGQGKVPWNRRFSRRKSRIRLQFPAVYGKIPSGVRSDLPCNLHFCQKRGDDVRRFSQRGAEGVNRIEPQSDGVENFLFFQSGKRWGRGSGRSSWREERQSLFRNGPVHVLQNIGGSGSQDSSVPDEGMASVGRMPVNRSGDAENVPALFGRRPGCDQSSAASGRFHHQRSAWEKWCGREANPSGTRKLPLHVRPQCAAPNCCFPEDTVC